MASIILLMSAATLCVVSMDLALACVYRKRAIHHKWTSRLIVFLSTALGLTGIELLSSWSSLVFEGKLGVFFYILWEVLKMGDATFLLVFVPFFSSWVVAYPLSRFRKLFFWFCGGLYLLLGILMTIFSQYPVLARINYGLVVIDLFYVLYVMIVTRRHVENRGIRLVTRAIVITASSVLPISILGVIYPVVRPLLIILAILSLGIVILVFLFIALNKKEKEEVVHLKKELSLSDLEKYHITGREFDVIMLIREGLTAKEIANNLSISVNTVNNHIANIFAKTEVNSRIDLLNLIQDIW